MVAQSTVASVRRALADLRAVEVDLNGQRGYLLPDDVETAEPVDLRPAFLAAARPDHDGLVRAGLVSRALQAALFDTSGNAGPTAWWDGRIVGGWRQTDSGEVVLDLLEDVGAEAMRALEHEAARLTDWFGGTRALPRFPSPLAKERGLGTAPRARRRETAGAARCSADARVLVDEAGSDDVTLIQPGPGVEALPLQVVGERALRVRPGRHAFERVAAELEPLREGAAASAHASSARARRRLPRGCAWPPRWPGARSRRRQRPHRGRCGGSSRVRGRPWPARGGS